MTRIVVAIDPAVTSGEEADETGIIVAGKDQNGHGYVLADISGRYPPTEWARLAITAYATHRADRIVAEVNNGGDMVGARLRMVDPNVAFTAVRASRGEVVRAEPVAALYQRGRVHHVGTERFDANALGPDSACGRAPLGGLLVGARRRGMSIARLHMRNSGDTAGPREPWSLWQLGAVRAGQGVR